MAFECFEREAHRNKYAMARYALAHSNLKFYMGIVRILSFLILLFMDRRNRRRMQSKAVSVSSSGPTAVAVVLPVYYDVINAFILWSFVFGILDISDQSVTRSHINVATSFSLFHFMVESLTFFLMQPGAGKKDFKHGIMFGTVVMLLSFTVFALSEFMFDVSDKVPIITFTIFHALLIGFYGTLLVTPVIVVFKRPALRPYAAFMMIYNIVWMSMNYLTYRGIKGSTCGTYLVYVLLDGVAVPLILYYTLSLDSQYWQGFLSNKEDNPLATDGWDVSLDIVSALSTSMVQPSFSTTQHIPVIHCGLVNFKNKLGFASGGFSRVYFGTYREEKVAVKMLFVMELTPSSIVEFFKEAQILHDLRNENVVECKGITIIPPAIGVIMERCLYGSLFDFLYNSLKRDKNDTSRSWFSSSYFSTVSKYSSKASSSAASHYGSQRCSLNSSHSTRESEVEMSPGRPRRPGSVKSPISATSPAVPTAAQADGWDDRNSVTTSPDQSQRKNSFPIFNTFFDRRVQSITRTQGSDQMRNREAIHDRPSADEYSDLMDYEMMRDAARGLAFIHAKGYMHCDIKSLNYLVSENLRVKIADVGEARPIDRSHTSASKKGSRPVPALNWCPPELLTPGAPEEYSTASDVFGLAMVFSEILIREPPLDGLTYGCTYPKWHSMLAVQNIRPKLPHNTIPEVREIIEAAWSTEPKLRPTAEEIALRLGQMIDRRRPPSADHAEGYAINFSVDRSGSSAACPKDFI